MLLHTAERARTFDMASESVEGGWALLVEETDCSCTLQNVPVPHPGCVKGVAGLYWSATAHTTLSPSLSTLKNPAAAPCGCSAAVSGVQPFAGPSLATLSGSAVALRVANGGCRLLSADDGRRPSTAADNSVIGVNCGSDRGYHQLPPTTAEFRSLAVEFGQLVGQLR